MSTDTPQAEAAKQVQVVSGITVRLAGDSGDGMQLLGTQLTNTSALAGNDVATFPDFPAEIRRRVERVLASAVFKFNLLRTRCTRRAIRWTR